MKGEEYQDFSLKLALFDLLPVITFSLSAILVGSRLNSPLFIVGAIITMLAGLCKVIWKLIVVIKDKSIKYLGTQMRLTMPLGFVLMIMALIINTERIDFNYIINELLSIPPVIFLFIFVLAMTLMFVFAFSLNKKSAKANWIEEITNVIGQVSLLICVLTI